MRKVVKYMIIGIAIIVIIILIINFYIKLTTKKQIINEEQAKKLENVDCILVLGAGIWNNKPSHMLEDRLLQSIALYDKSKSTKIIMSGDHSS